MKKPTVLVLHGWGVGGAPYNELVSLLRKEGFTVFAPDLPGFGSEPLPRSALTLDDYIDFTKEYIKKNIQGKYYIIGHSFGARISIKFAASHPKDLLGLVLTGAAGIRRPLPLRSRIAFLFAKAGRMIIIFSPLHKILRKVLYTMVGEMDYYKAEKLRETFKNIIYEDLKTYLPEISVPTLFVWGQYDFVTPVSDGEYMQKHVAGSKLVIVKGGPHSLIYKIPHVFIEKILPFLKE